MKEGREGGREGSVDVRSAPCISGLTSVGMQGATETWREGGREGGRDGWRVDMKEGRKGY